MAFSLRDSLVKYLRIELSSPEDCVLFQEFFRSTRIDGYVRHQPLDARPDLYLLKTAFVEKDALEAEENFYSLEFRDKQEYYKDIWMVIGATNHGNDYLRFGNCYDFSICNPYTNDQWTDRVAVNNLKTFGEKIYPAMKEYLAGRFERILFDWSVTKFFLSNGTLWTTLQFYGHLLKKGGELYVDSFTTGQKMPFILRGDGDVYRLADGKGKRLSSDDIKTLRRDADESISIQILDAKPEHRNILGIVSFIQLFQEDTITRSQLQAHLKAFPDNVSTRERLQKSIDQIILANLLSILEGFKIEKINDHQYPNNAFISIDDEVDRRVFKYWKITRL